MKIFYCILAIFVAGLVGYLFGAVSNSRIIGEIFFHKDVMKEGSKNPGATNAGRILGKKIAVIVVILDMLKIILPFFAAFYLFTNVQILKEITFYSEEYNSFGRGNTLNQLAYYIVPLCGIIGHCYSVFLNFKGGKAVSSFFGYTVSLTYITFPIGGFIFFGILKGTRKVSLGSLISTLCVTIAIWIIYFIYAFAGPQITQYLTYFGYGPEMCIYAPFVTTISYLILLYRHKANIERLRNNQENEVHWFKK